MAIRSGIIALIANAFAPSTSGAGRRKSPGSSGVSPLRRRFRRRPSRWTLHDQLQRVGDRQPDNARRVLASQSLYSAAKQVHSQAVLTRDAASKVLDAQSANPTGKDLSQLRATLVQAEQAVADAVNALHNATLVHERTVRASATPAMRTHLEKSGGLLASTQVAQAQAEQRHQAVTEKYHQEVANPSGKNLTGLELAIGQYEVALAPPARVISFKSIR